MYLTHPKERIRSANRRLRLESKGFYTLLSGCPPPKRRLLPIERAANLEMTFEVGPTGYDVGQSTWTVPGVPLQVARCA